MGTHVREVGVICRFVSFSVTLVILDVYEVNGNFIVNFSYVGSDYYAGVGKTKIMLVCCVNVTYYYDCGSYFPNRY